MCRCSSFSFLLALLEPGLLATVLCCSHHISYHGLQRILGIAPEVCSRYRNDLSINVSLIERQHRPPPQRPLITTPALLRGHVQRFLVAEHQALGSAQDGLLLPSNIRDRRQDPKPICSHVVKRPASDWGMMSAILRTGASGSCLGVTGHDANRKLEKGSGSELTMSPQVCVLVFLTPTCGPKGHGSSLPLPLRTAAAFLRDHISRPKPLWVNLGTPVDLLLSPAWRKEWAKER